MYICILLVGTPEDTVPTVTPASPGVTDPPINTVSPTNNSTMNETTDTPTLKPPSTEPSTGVCVCVCVYLHYVCLLEVTRQ